MAIVMYGGVGNGSPLSPGGLLTVDQGTGAGTLVGDPITPGGLTGISFNSSGTLFGSSIFGGASSLVVINPDTGALVSTIGAISDGVGGPTLSIGDLAFQPGTDVLFGITSNAVTPGDGGKL
jgi:hypothetical protein